MDPEGSSLPPEKPSAIPEGNDSRRILENLPVPVVLATLEENPRLLFVNRQFHTTFGYTLEDIPTQADWARLAYPDEAYRREVFEKWNAAVARAASEQGAVESMEFRVAAKDGTARDILFNAIVLGDTLQVTLTDLTARRTAERELHTAREKLERTAYEVTENMPAGTYTMVLPPGGGMARFSFMSSRFLELCGLERRAAEENPFNAFACVHPDDHAEWVRKNAECFEKKIPFSEECRVIAHGVERWILAESVPRDLPDGSTVWEGVLTDITPRKTAERELAALREREREGEARQRDDLERKLRASLTAAAAAHEINQPLGRILLTTQLVLDNESVTDGADSKLSGFLRELANEAQSVVSTIEKMKALIRNVETRRKPLDLGELVESALLYAGPFAREAGVGISFARPAKATRLLGDSDQLQIALNNLLRNAMESLAETGPENPKKIQVELTPGKDWLELVVGDSGPGFPENGAGTQLFQSTKPQGSGLGLFIVRTAAENHGGRVETARSPLGGAEVRMVFPIESTG